MVAVVQLAIGLGAGVGGLLYDQLGYQATFAASSVLLIVASGLAVLTSRIAARLPVPQDVDADRHRASHVRA
ncbi:hypothetical protein [Lysobacter sp. HA18]